MAQFTIYTASGSGAPVLNGRTGSLISVLDACLVNGYGGTGSLGWTKVFSSSYSPGSSDNRAAYLMPSRSFYLRVFDDSTSGNTVTAAIKFDETLSSIDTASFSSNAYVRKSDVASDTAKYWMLIGDSKTFYMFILADSPAYTGWMFGDFDSYMPNDQYNVIGVGRTPNSTGAGSSFSGEQLDVLVAWTRDGNFIARTYARNYITSSITSTSPCGRHGDGNAGVANNMYGNVTFTNPEDSAIYLSPVWVGEPTFTMRGKMRGFWQWLHPIASINDGDTFSGTGELNGKTFLIIKSTPNSGVYIIETSNTLS